MIIFSVLFLKELLFYHLFSFNLGGFVGKFIYLETYKIKHHHPPFISFLKLQQTKRIQQKVYLQSQVRGFSAKAVVLTFIWNKMYSSILG